MLTNEVTRFGGVTTTRRKQIERGGRERESVATPSVEKGDRKRGRERERRIGDMIEEPEVEDVVSSQ